MKKISALLLTLCAALCVFAFAACSDGDTENGNTDNTQTADTTVITTDTSVIFTVDGDFYTLSDSTSVYDYLSALQTAGKLTFVSTTSSYGEYITTINGTEEVTSYTDAGSSGTSWTLYTTLTTLDGVTYSSDYSTYTYESTTLYSSSYGVSYLPAVDGETYAFVFEDWSYSY